MASGIVISAKGGTGKTTFAINLAKVLADDLQRRKLTKKQGVLYVDFDICDPNGSLRLDELGANNFYSLFKGYDTGVDTVELQSLCRQVKKANISILGSEVLGAQQREELARLYATNRYATRFVRDLDQLINLYDHCIIDTPGGGLASFIPLLLGSDFVYNVFDLRDQPSIRSSEKCLIDFYYFCHKFRHVKNTGTKMMHVVFSFYSPGQARRYRKIISDRLADWFRLNLDERSRHPIDPWIAENFAWWFEQRAERRRQAVQEYIEMFLTERVRFLDGLPKSDKIELANTQARPYSGSRFENMFREGVKKIENIADLFLREAEFLEGWRQRGVLANFSDFAAPASARRRRSVM